MPTEHETRKRLAEDLGIPHCPQALWEFLAEDRPDEVQAARDGGAVEMRDLVRVARRFLRYHRALVRDADAERPTPRSSGAGETDATRIKRSFYFELLGDYAAARAEAVSEQLALQATGDPEVINYRERVLQNRLLTEVEAQDRLLDQDFRGEPIAASSQADGLHAYRSTSSEPPGLDAADDPHSQPDQHSDSPETSMAAVTVYLRDSYRDLRYQRNSALGSLVALAEGVQSRYGWTDTGDTIWFILTGVAPLHQPVIAGRTLDGLVRIPVVEPWVPVEVLAAFYQYQRQCLSTRRPRALKPKNLKLVAFTARVLRRNLDYRWLDVMLAWNTANPGERYTRPELMQRDYVRTLRTILPDPLPGRDPG